MVLDGELDEGVRPLQLELFADAGAMELDRADAQTEDVGDLRISNETHRLDAGGRFARNSQSAGSRFDSEGWT